jgi:hypothetical protein
MSTVNFRSDECYLEQKAQSNKSVFDYMVDINKFTNQNECFDATPTFLSYIPLGVPKQNVDIENELRGTTRSNTRCASVKFQSPEQGVLASIGNEVSVISQQKMYPGYPNNKKECAPVNKILPNGYFGPLA